MIKNLKRVAAFFMTVALILAMSATAFAAVEDTGFADVDANAWHAEAVTYCRDNGFMQGTGTAVFSPEDTMTRAMLVTVLYRLSGSPVVTGNDSFTDTTDGAWYSDAVLWASQNGVVSGYGNGLFGSNDPVTREQIATILWRYDGSAEVNSSADFADEDNIASYAMDAVDWARANGIVSGIGGNTFSPKSSATRAQVATILMNYSRNEPTDPVSDHNVLVAYFSGTGTTRGVAQNIADALGSEIADLYEITPEQPYTEADLDYTNSNCRAVLEQQDSATRPAISGSVDNMDQYDVVFLGYPIWNNDAPRIIYTFLENEEFRGKTIVPFCTSGGSGITNSVSNIRGLANDANWLDGRRCSSSDSASTLATWIDGLNLDFSNGSTTPDSETTPTPSQENRVLVAYFSATNNTEGVAQHIADALEADTYEIIPAEPYTSADLNYGNSSSRATVEMNDPNARPEIADGLENMEDYDIIFLGYPIWWGQAPRIISTFLESYDFDGKTIVPFCTSASSGIGSSASNLHDLTAGAGWLSSQRFSAGSGRSTVVTWINSLGLDLTAV